MYNCHYLGHYKEIWMNLKIRNSEDAEYMRKIADHFVVGNRQFYREHILQIMENLDFPNIKPEFLPNAEHGQNSLSKRRKAMNKLSFNLWGLSVEKWLKTEKEWLSQARDKVGVTRNDGKDEDEDVVSTQILIRIYATAYFFYKHKSPFDQKQVLRGLNSFLETAIFKGYSRCTKIGDVTLYQEMTESGLPVAGSGKYLPDPQNTFWQLLSLLHRNSINPEVYK